MPPRAEERWRTLKSASHQEDGPEQVHPHGLRRFGASRPPERGHLRFRCVKVPTGLLLALQPERN